MSYQPYGRTKTILEKAMEHIESVPYQVSVRWVFYRLLQEGFYNEKKDYVKFIMLTSRARKNWYGNWSPSTLADDTRSMKAFVNAGEEIPAPDISLLIEEQKDEALGEIEYHKDQAENYVHRFSYEIDPNYYQHNFCLIMFEARAMMQQFRTYTHGLTLCPFGGQPSIPYKWNIAKYIEQECEKYSKDAIVLYFGDLDEAGSNIFYAGREDITNWCDAKVTFIRCGLTQEHVEKYQIPENFEHPGYQWEALTDTQAREIINESLEQYYNFMAAQQARDEELQIQEQVENAVNEYLNDGGIL